MRVQQSIELLDSGLDDGNGCCDRWVDAVHPSRELAGAELECGAFDRRYVNRWRRVDAGVSGQQVTEQQPLCGFAVVEEEVAEVERGLGTADLAEVDEAGVVAARLKNVGAIEVTVRKMRDTSRRGGTSAKT